MDVKPGMRLQSTVCSTEVVVVRPPIGPVDLRCGGAMMVPIGTAPPASPDAMLDGPGTQLGKRYVDEATGIELLCTKAGLGRLSLGNTALLLKDAKPLPSSD